MKRRNLLKSLGALGIASIVPSSATNSLAKIAEPKVKTVLPTVYKGNPICWLTPQKTAGPYYFNANLNRQDIRYDTLHNNQFFDGVPLNMTFNIINLDCQPISGVIVDIWQCDKDGAYSGYNGQPGGNWAGWDFMRGLQVTDLKGSASFITSYPGWYPGRATHIHFKIRLNSSTYVTSQFCFPDSLNNTIYATPLYAARGPNPVTNAMDNTFLSPEPQYLIMYPEPNGSGEYDGNYTVGINAPLGINDPGIEIEGYNLEQNYPNPFNPSTKIAYIIPVSTRVKITVYDVMGKEITVLVNEHRTAGKHEIIFQARNLSSGYYTYKMEAEDFIQSKDMLLVK